MSLSINSLQRTAGVGPAFDHGHSMPRISDLLARVSEAAFALTRQSLEVPRMVEIRAQERNVTDWLLEEIVCRQKICNWFACI